MGKTGYLLLGVGVIAVVAYVFRESLFGSPGASGTVTAATGLPTDALDFGIRGAVSGATDAIRGAVVTAGLDEQEHAPWTAPSASVSTSLTLGKLVGARKVAA